MTDDFATYSNAVNQKKTRDYQKRLADFINANKHLPTLERAEAYLSFVAHDSCGEYGDEEAIVYLASRGVGVEDAVNQMIARWKADIEYLMPLAKIAKVRGTPTALLPNFWLSCHHYQEPFMDAALLRVVDWCQIGGFDEWWERVFLDERASALTDGVEQVPMSYWLSAMARSPFARERLESSLARSLDAILLPPTSRSEAPWEHFGLFSTSDSPHCTDHFGVAANIGMATVMVNHKPSELSERAAQRLVETQRAEGGWPRLATMEDLSIETTARAMHAVALNHPRGWNRSCNAAAKWLVQHQTEGGYWWEPEMPDPRFLTVLALDALALAASSQVTTFQRIREPLVRHSDSFERRFLVGLTFPGEARDLVEQVANELAGTHGQHRILYDRFHAAEFARPNLDTHLQRLYHEESKLVVVFFGADYDRKEWPGLEWRAVRDLIKSKKADNRIMLVRLDHGPVEGLYSIDGYVDVAQKMPSELASLIIERVGQLAS